MALLLLSNLEEGRSARRLRGEGRQERRGQGLKRVLIIGDSIRLGAPEVEPSLSFQIKLSTGLSTGVQGGRGLSTGRKNRTRGC